MPILSKLPIIGALFKAKADRAEQTELMVLDHAASGPSARSGRSAAAADAARRVPAAADAPASRAPSKGVEGPARSGDPDAKAITDEQQSTQMHMMITHTFADARGAVLVHVAVMLLALMAFTALVVRLRRAFREPAAGPERRRRRRRSRPQLSLVRNANDLPLARNSAIAAAQRKIRCGAAAGHPGDGRHVPGVSAGCTRRAARASGRMCFRTTLRAGGGFPLPTFFANIVGVGEQGTRATATAQWSRARARPIA